MKLTGAVFRLLSAVLALSVSLFAAPLQAGVAEERGGFRPHFIQVQKREISRDQAAAIVKRRYGGKILAISEVNRDGRPMYRVKGLSDKSQVYVVYVDKQSGRISR